MSRPNALSWGSEGSYIYDPNEEKVIDIQETRKNKFTVITQMITNTYSIQSSKKRIST